MLGMLFFISLLATAWMAFQSKRKWDDYHRAGVTRTQMVNQVSLTGVLAVVTVLLFVLGRFIRI